VDNVLLFFFIQVKPVSPDFRIEVDWLKCATTQNRSYSVGQLIFISLLPPLTFSMHLTVMHTCPLRQTRKMFTRIYTGY